MVCAMHWMVLIFRLLMGLVSKCRRAPLFRQDSPLWLSTAPALLSTWQGERATPNGREPPGWNGWLWIDGRIQGIETQPARACCRVTGHAIRRGDPAHSRVPRQPL